MLQSLALINLFAASSMLHGLANGLGQLGLQNSTSVIGTAPCDALLAAGLEDRVLLPTDPLYEERINSFFSVSSRLRPWCIVYPHAVSEVSTALTALVDAGSGAGDWHIAVRSGGHAQWAGSNSITNGVVIDLGFFNVTTYDETTATASLQPGSRWRDVFAKLWSHGVVVPGGRDGSVGVGGFLLGGGRSYYSGRLGFGVDSVRNFEVVLANGSVVNANGEANPDLYKALKGGGSNFGIVTRYDMAAIPAGELLVGNYVVPSNGTDALVEAIATYASSGAATDEALVALLSYDAKTGPEVVYQLSYVNTDGRSNSSTFSQLGSLPSVNSAVIRTNIADLTSMPGLPSGYRNVWFTLTFKASRDVLRHGVALHEQLVADLKEAIPAADFHTQCVIQPLPGWSKDTPTPLGQNVIGIDKWLTSPGILWLCQARVTTEQQESIARLKLASLTADLESFAKSGDSDLGWRFLNYADPSQDPLGSYGEENVDFIRQVAAKYDPNEVFQSRVPGGFKISRVA